MKKSVLGIALALLVAATLLTGALAADDVTVISSPDELIAFRNSVNNGNDYAGRTVVLGDNIDLSLQDIDWTPIGQARAAAAATRATPSRVHLTGAVSPSAD